MARADQYTLLSLDRYARIMGINPVHFAGCSAGDYFPMRNRCADIWFQHSWQGADSVSREDLAAAIYDAEEAMARELGFYPAPKWIAQEVHQWPRFYRRDRFRGGGLNVRGQRVSLKTRFARVIQAGERQADPIGTATVAAGTLAYSDADGDGFAERATITLSTTVTAAAEIKVFHAGYDGAQEWEIRDPWYKEVSSGGVEIRFHVWQMVRPELWEAFPTTAGPGAIDLSGLAETPPVTTNLVQSVEVYREHTPTTERSATLYWEPTPRGVTEAGYCSLCGGSGCEACLLTTQDGCLHVRDAELGLVVPQPATYDTDEAAWTQNCFTWSRDPDYVMIWYYAGDTSNPWRVGTVVDPLSKRWADAISWLATARLERPFCSCGNVKALADHLRDDLAAVSSTQQQAQSYQLGREVLSNPFGTRRGEVMAWNVVSRARRVVGGAVA